MKYIILIILILNISVFAFDDAEYYNLQIKQELKLEYNPHIVASKTRTRSLRWDEVLLDKADRYIDEKHAQYLAAKQKLEEDFTLDLNRTIVPATMKEDLRVIVNLDENPKKIKIIYRYDNPIIKDAYTDFGLIEEQLQLSFNIRKEFKGLESPFSERLTSIFEYVNERVDFLF